MKREDDQDPHSERHGDSPAGSGESRLADLVFRYIERLNDGGGLDEERILREEPELGPSIVTELRTHLGFGSTDLADDDVPLGTLGDYALRREIGRGGMGVVYDAWQSSSVSRAEAWLGGSSNPSRSSPTATPCCSSTSGATTSS